MSKILSEFEKEQRKGNSNYFKNGKLKKGSILCMDKDYITGIIRINGNYNVNWTCGGNRCPLYATGCDNRGKDWD